MSAPRLVVWSILFANLSRKNWKSLHPIPLEQRLRRVAYFALVQEPGSDLIHAISRLFALLTCLLQTVRGLARSTASPPLGYARRTAPRSSAEGRLGHAVATNEG